MSIVHFLNLPFFTASDTFFMKKDSFIMDNFYCTLGWAGLKKGSFCIRSGYDRLKYCLQSCVFHIHHLLKAREILLSSFKKSK